LEQRDIKALSERQMGDLWTVRGMGLALAAELNGYPGPLHVLGLCDKPGLSVEQKGKVQQLFEAMTTEAVAAGEKLIESERALNAEFAARTITLHRLELPMAQIGERQGALRAVHLRYHLTTAKGLRPPEAEGGLEEGLARARCHDFGNLHLYAGRWG